MGLSIPRASVSRGELLPLERHLDVGADGIGRGGLAPAGRTQLTPDQVKYRLIQSASPIGANGQSYAYLDVYAAVTGSTTASANTGLQASQMLWSGDEPITWESVNWNSVNWNSVNRNSVNWNSVNWNSVNWNSATVVEIDDYYMALRNRTISAADFVWTTPGLAKRSAAGQSALFAVAYCTGMRSDNGESGSRRLLPSSLIPDSSQRRDPKMHHGSLYFLAAADVRAQAGTIPAAITDHQNLLALCGYG